MPRARSNDARLLELIGDVLGSSTWSSCETSCSSPWTAPCPASSCQWFSDVVSGDELHSLALYREFYAELGVEHQIAFVIDVSPPFYVGIALSRGGRDFTDAERTLLDRARPYLIQMYRTAIAQTELQARLRAPGLPDAQLERLVQRGLTGREAAVLVRVARGQSTKVIAADLDVSERTIGKHLQRCYRKLGAANRSDAAAVVWDVGAASGARVGP